MSVPVKKDSAVIKVANDGNVHTVCHSIAMNYMKDKSTRVRAIGMSAVNQAVKAIIKARSILLSNSIDVSVIPEFTTIKSERGDGGHVTAVVFRFREEEKK